MPNPKTTTSYVLREIPAELWALAKHRAIDERTSLREIIFRALKKYCEKEDTK